MLEAVNGRLRSGIRQARVCAGKLRFLASSRVLVNDVLLRGAVDTPLGLFESREFIVGSACRDEVLDSGLHLRLCRLVPPFALGSLPYRFLCV